jgi:regulator of sirC expression with transglutaminase-like and TPR domain
MKNEQEISALIHLLDDPDELIYDQVRDRLISYGPQVVAPLETAWEQSLDVLLQERIENIVHYVQFQSVKQDLALWHQSGGFDLLQGILIINRYQFPDLDEQAIINQIDEIKREIWLGLKEEMSATDQIKYFNHVFYKEFGFRGNTKNHLDPQNSYINQVLESKKGNQISLAIIYATIAQKLDLPVQGINLPQHFILGYMDQANTANPNSVLFYINAFNRGMIFARHDVDQFLRQLNVDPHPTYYQPCSHTEIVKRVLRNLISAYERLGALDKVAELKQLQDILV